MYPLMVASYYSNISEYLFLFAEELSTTRLHLLGMTRKSVLVICHMKESVKINNSMQKENVSAFGTKRFGI